MNAQQKTVDKLSDAQVGDYINFRGTVVVEKRYKDVNEPYLFLKLADRSGKATAVMWNENGLYSFFEKIKDDEYIEARCYMQKNGAFQNIHFTQAKICEREEDWLVNLRQLPVSLGRILRKIEHPELKKMLFVFFNDESKYTAYFDAPLSINGAGAFKGGVLASVVRLCKLIDSSWNTMQLWEKEMNMNSALKSSFSKDLLKTIAILEPIGKTRTLTMRRNKVVLTKEGNLLSDRMITMQVVNELLRITELNEDEKTLFLHVLGAVHEDESFSGQIVGKSREAVILNHLRHLNISMMQFEAMDFKKSFEAPNEEFYFNNNRNYYMMNFDDCSSETEKVNA